MSKNYDGFAEKLRSLLNDKSLSQNELAKALGVSEGTVRNWLAGRGEPGVSQIIAIVDFANVDVAWLLGVNDAPEYRKAANTILKCFNDYRPRSGEPLHETIYDFVDGWNVGTVMSSPVDEDNESITLAFKLFPKITYENIDTKSFKLPKSAIPSPSNQETDVSEEDNADELLVSRFYSFEAHEIEMRDHQDQPGVGIPPKSPTRENVLAQFCGLYNQFGPMGVGLPNWMSGKHPSLTPEIIIAAIKIIAPAQTHDMDKQSEQGKQEWSTISPLDWSGWMAVVAELAANGVPPSEVLAQFRPPQQRIPYLKK